MGGARGESTMITMFLRLAAVIAADEEDMWLTC
jgi:hypothetical protein